MKPAVVLPPTPQSSEVTVQSELYSRLQSRLAQLREESEKVHANMERALFRIMTQREAVCLEGLTVGRWEALAAEVAAIQESLQALEDLQ